MINDLIKRGAVDLYREISAMEDRMGHTFKNGKTLAEFIGEDAA